MTVATRLVSQEMGVAVGFYGDPTHPGALGYRDMAEGLATAIVRAS